MLSYELNNKILRLAPKFDAKDFAPDSFDSLLRTKAIRLVVWSGASDQTIYGNPQVNHAARAWHDSIHIKLGADFSLDGEKRVALEQARLIGSDKLALIILGEVVGQAEYLAKYGHFPVDQVRFLREYIKNA